MINSEAEYIRLLTLVRPMTYEEYCWIKNSIEYYYQTKVLDAHIGIVNRKEMGSTNIYPGRTKYPLYLNYYRVYNSKLGALLR